jgi:hypothetical protein
MKKLLYSGFITVGLERRERERPISRLTEELINAESRASLGETIKNEKKSSISEHNWEGVHSAVR